MPYVRGAEMSSTLEQVTDIYARTKVDNYVRGKCDEI